MPRGKYRLPEPAPCPAYPSLETRLIDAIGGFGFPEGDETYEIVPDLQRAVEAWLQDETRSWCQQDMDDDHKNGASKFGGFLQAAALV